MKAFPIAFLGSFLALTAPTDAAPLSQVPLGAKLTLARSVGAPNEGRLDGGTRLHEAPYLRVVPYYAPSDARWGLPSLVGLIDRAARRVARRFPDAVLSVGDLSRQSGGELVRHHSHESGRDADIGFYLRNAARKPLLAARFVPFAPDGTSDLPGAAFDDARNWALVEAMVDDPVTRIAQIFVAAHIRARLLRYAEQSGAPLALRQRAAEMMMQPRKAPHDDHFHVRIACPHDQQSTCVEFAVARGQRPAMMPLAGRQRSSADRRGRSLPTLPPTMDEQPALRADEEDEDPGFLHLTRHIP